MARLHAVWILGGLIGLGACSDDSHEPEAEFVDLYVDLKLASSALGNDLERAGEMRRVILAQHGMTSAEFHEHFMRLADRPEAWKPFQERVVARIETMQQKREGESDGQ